MLAILTKNTVLANVTTHLDKLQLNGIQSRKLTPAPERNEDDVNTDKAVMIIKINARIAYP